MELYLPVAGLSISLFVVIAIGALVVLDALARLLTAWMLLRARHRGPGLWWSAICVTIALGVVYHPLFGVVMGGIASVPGIGPDLWGGLFLAMEMLFLFRAFGQGRAGALWALVPLFVVWANVDVSFLVGLIVLATAVVGRWLDGGNANWLVASSHAAAGEAAIETAGEPSQRPSQPVAVAHAFMILGLCVAACLVNPWTYRAYLAALKPFILLFQPSHGVQFPELYSFFGAAMRDRYRSEWYLLAGPYLLVVGLGIGSFWLNASRFSWSRFLPFAATSLLWGAMMRYGTEFAIVFATVAALNGQEWYHDRFGTEGRLGRGWALWSTGGRLLALSLIFAAIGKDITGWHNVMGGNRFGPGYEVDDVPFEAADFLELQNEIKGNVLNTSKAQGDVLIWKTFPKRKTFVDGRVDLFPVSLYEQWHKIRKALSEDDVETWKPLLDQYGISAVMIEPSGAPITYTRLFQSANWVPFYDDGRIVMFGRADAPASDLAVFKANRLDPERVYRLSRPLPASAGPPGQTSWIDEVFQNRTYNRPQMRNASARRWLEMGASPSQPMLPEPAQCLLAIQEARIALSRSPDDWQAFRTLNDAYRFLAIRESAMLAGIVVTPENRTQLSRVAPSAERLMNRFRQRVTALSFAIQTTPPPQSPQDRRDLFELNMQLAELFLSVNFRDLARDRMQTALDLAQVDDFLPPEGRAQLGDQINQLTQVVKQVEDKLADLEFENQAGPVDQAAFARQQGAVGLAISKFAEAERNGVSPMVVKPQLVDLYCSTGQPDKALELLNVGSIEDPNLGTEPGTAAYRQGLVYLLLGNYLSTASLWQDRAIARLRNSRSNQVLGAGLGMVRGQALQAANTFLSLPSSLGQQASWEFELALCQLEAGLPDAAAGNFTRALTLDPNLAGRPIAAYYLEKMGKPVPPKRETAADKKKAATAARGPTAAAGSPSATSPAPAPAPAPVAEPAKSPAPDKAKAGDKGGPAKGPS
jgi:tetratricopeptide (TPR) repeat protein